MPESFVTFGTFLFDEERRLLYRQGVLVPVGQKGLAILATLVAARGRPVAKSELLSAAWSNTIVEDSNLPVQIAALRKCLGRTPDGDEWIITVQRFGYQFLMPPQRSDREPASADPSRRSSFARKLSVAILPFVDTAADEGHSYLSDGITDDIITSLTRWSILSVRSHFASFNHRHATADFLKIGTELDANYIVTGKIRQHEDMLRINIKLIDRDHGSHLWAEDYDIKKSAFFDVRDEIVRTIVSTLVGRVAAFAHDRAVHRNPSTFGAFDCVLRGNALPWNDPDGLNKATEHFTKAIELDRHYGLAHALLALMHRRHWINDDTGSDVHLETAYRLAKRAVDLDPTESTSFSVLGHIHLLKRSFESAIHFSKRAVEINPGNQWNIADHGQVLTYAGDASEALKCFERARQIDPYFNPPWYWSGMGEAFLTLRRPEEAIAAFDHHPSHSYRTIAMLSACHARIGNRRSAMKLKAECVSIRPSITVENFLLKTPYRDPSNADYLAESLRMAGFE